MLQPGVHVVPLTFQGQERPYRLHVPSGGSPAPRPLVLQLHGRGGGGPWFERIVGFNALAERMGFVLAVPDAIDGVWNDGRFASGHRFGTVDDVGYRTALVGDAMARTPVDPRRVYVFGMSTAGRWPAAWPVSEPTASRRWRR